MSRRFFFLILVFLLGTTLGEVPSAFAKKELLSKSKKVEKVFISRGPSPYLGREHRDPTLNPLLSRTVQKESKAPVEVVKLPDLTVQGVIWGKDAAKAIIEKRVVAKGDILPEGIEILDISGAGIKVLYKGKIFTVLPQGVVEER